VSVSNVFWRCITSPGCAQTALECDDRIGEAHATLALLKFYIDWDFDGAEEAFHRAFECAPNYATARHEQICSRARASSAGCSSARHVGLEPAFASMKRDHTDIVIVLDDSLFMTRRREIAGLAAQYQLPSIAGNSEYASAGFIMSYGSLISEEFRRGATYVDKILKGAKPADLPVEQPTRFYLTINQRTANALGVTIPWSLLLRADEVIQ
jgi:ABC transporter substrate binding protein